MGWPGLGLVGNGVFTHEVATHLIYLIYMMWVQVLLLEKLQPLKGNYTRGKLV